MNIDKRKIVKLVEDNLSSLEETPYSVAWNEKQFVRLFGVANWLDSLLREIGEDDWDLRELRERLYNAQANLYENGVVPGLDIECPRCNVSHEELLDFSTAYVNAKPLLILQQSDSGKLYLAYRFLMGVNPSMAIELGGRTTIEQKDGIGYSVVRLSVSDLEEMVFNHSNPRRDFVKRHISEVRKWEESIAAVEFPTSGHILIPHIESFVRGYKIWKPVELKEKDRKVEPKWDQHVDDCWGRVKNLHIGNLGYMDRCYICCAQEDCKDYNSVCAAQAEG